MSRSLVSLRCAGPDDAIPLAELWGNALRRADHHDQVADLDMIIKVAADSPEERIVVADYDGNFAGAVFLRVTTLSPINLDACVQAISPQVLPQFRRHGVGRTLMESAVAFAEELGIGHVSTAALSSSRDGNRFMARLGFGPQAVFRVATTHAVRAKLTALRPAFDRHSGGRHLSQVLAARRSQRRSQTPTSP